MIGELIDKQDGFEIVRSKIVEILKTEIANQQLLAAEGGKDPEDWRLDIFEERSNAWEQYLNDTTNVIPIVNVWFDNERFDKDKGDVVKRQQAEGVFNIDCYGYAFSSDNVAGGHNPGDRAAALECQKAMRLVRNILMAAQYTYLGLRKLVGMRWPQSVTAFQPQLSGNFVQQIWGARLALSVQYLEESPQVVGDVLEFVSVDAKRAEDDSETLVLTEYDYT